MCVIDPMGCPYHLQPGHMEGGSLRTAMDSSGPFNEYVNIDMSDIMSDIFMPDIGL
jgi:hypothetical protein